MLPLPQVIELDEVPPEFFCMPTGRASGLSGLDVLTRFRDLMQAQGWTVQPARLCYDRPYAYERIAQAHSCADPLLRAVALELFQTLCQLDARRATSH